MKLKFIPVFVMYCSFLHAQTDVVPELIPKKLKSGLYGYVDTNSVVVIGGEYQYASFFSEDCNLLNSPEEKLRVYGSANYATVEKNQQLYRINKNGKRVYRFKNSELGNCNLPYVSPKYRAYIVDDYYGLVSKTEGSFSSPEDFVIYPQYQMLYVLSGDRDNPMIVAVKDDKFGVINKENQIIIPFEYEEIKTNFSWKIANLFEVSYDGENYFYIDRNNKAY